jgi:hypothetical protein
MVNRLSLLLSISAILPVEGSEMARASEILGFTVGGAAVLTAYQTGRTIYTHCSEKRHCREFSYDFFDSYKGFLSGIAGIYCFGFGLIGSNPFSLFSKTLLYTPFTVTRFIMGISNYEMSDGQEAFCAISAIAFHYAAWKALQWSFPFREQVGGWRLRYTVDSFFNSMNPYRISPNNGETQHRFYYDTSSGAGNSD